nr:hypothetical protein [Ardenticatenia bacterium]
HAPPPPNRHEHPNDDTHPFANGHEHPSDDTHPFANGYEHLNDDTHPLANGHENPDEQTNGHKPPLADGHTDPDPGSDSHSGTNGNKPSHQHTCNNGDQLSHEHCNSDKNPHHDTFAHIVLRRAQDTVANQSPDFNAPGPYGHAPATDGNRNPDRLEPASKDANPDRYPRGIADLPSPCGFGPSLVSWRLARCPWNSRAGMAGLFVRQREALVICSGRVLVLPLPAGPGSDGSIGTRG